MSTAHSHRKKVLSKIIDQLEHSVFAAMHKGQDLPKQAPESDKIIQDSINTRYVIAPANWGNVTKFSTSTAPFPKVRYPAKQLKPTRKKADASVELPYVATGSITCKSIFEMTPDEFKAAVRDRSVQLAEERWDKGLPLSIPVGDDTNEFVHIYKGGHSRLVVLDEKTGKVKPKHTRF